MKRWITFLLTLNTLFAASVTLWAQSSSKDLPQKPARATDADVSRDGRATRLSPAIARGSLMAVTLPEPRRFELHDLITIIIREQLRNDHTSKLETDKEYDLKGEISQFPDLQLSKLLQFTLQGSGTNNPPKVRIKVDNSFDGEGDYSRSDTVTGRITARIIDIKPNGTLVLEARKYIRADKEDLKMILTGSCRKDDITADNTILSTQIYDMQLIREHSGEVRESIRKGWLTKLFDTIFNF